MNPMTKESLLSMEQWMEMSKGWGSFAKFEEYLMEIQK